MNIKTPVFRQQFVKEHGCLIKPLKIGIQTTPPSISVGLLLKNRWQLYEGCGLVFFGFRIVRNRCGEGKICACIEGWVYVNEVDLAGELRQQAGQDVLLVTPDQPVTPLGFPTGGKKIKGPLPILRALIDRLDGLKRKGYPDRRDLLAVLILPIPDKLGHS